LMLEFFLHSPSNVSSYAVLYLPERSETRDGNLPSLARRLGDWLNS